MKHFRILKLTASFTAICFLFTQTGFAAPALQITQRHETPAVPALSVPAELATIDHVFQSPESSRFILQIQNAHANYGAQLKIHDLLNDLNKTYGIQAVFIEGAAEKLNPDYLKAFSNPKQNEKFLDVLVQQGILDGAGLFIQDRIPGVEGLPIEEVSLYRKNYEALKKVYSAESEIDRELSKIETRISKEASKQLSSELRATFSEWQLFEKGQREFLPSINRLSEKAHRVLGLDLHNVFSQADWPQIAHLLALQETEKKLDLSKAQEENARLVSFLKIKQISGRVIDGIASLSSIARNDGKIVSLRGGPADEAISYRQMFENLITEARPQGFRLADWPAFTNFVAYQILQQELDAQKLHKEIESLFAKLIASLAKTQEQKKLVALYQDFGLFTKLLHLELSRAEFSEFQKRNITFDRFEIASPSARNDVIARSDLRRSNLSDFFKSALTFYALALRRDQMFYQKLDQQMREKGITKAVIVTGGFHTEGLSDIFRKEKTSFAVLTPRISEIQSPKLYQDLMLGTKSLQFQTSFLGAAEPAQSPSILGAMGFSRFAQHVSRPIAFAKSELRSEVRRDLSKVTEAYMGVNSSTQSLTITVGDPNGVLFTHQERFEQKKYKRFGSPEGYIQSINRRNPNRFLMNPLMVAFALEEAMKALQKFAKENKLDLKAIKAISPGGQQHALVYLTNTAFRFGSVGKSSLEQKIKENKALAWRRSAIWKDKSTNEESKKVVEAFGDQNILRKKTGSEFQHRFAAAQIAKFAADYPEKFENTDRILTLPAYVGYLLSGTADFPWDTGEAIPSHLAELTTKFWHTSDKFDRIASGLANKLPAIQYTDDVVGNLDPHWRKYGFDAANTRIAVGTGDNPANLIGMGMINSEMTISLGTSFVISTKINNQRDLARTLKSKIGNIMGSPFGKWMKLVCFQNGGLALKRIRDQYINDHEAEQYARGNYTEHSPAMFDNLAPDKKREIISRAKWEIFEEELKKTNPANNGAMMITQSEDEKAIDVKFDTKKPHTAGNLDLTNRPQALRAAVEGQIYFLKYAAERAGLKLEGIKQINLTGGVAKNASIRQIIADVFNAEVKTLEGGVDSVSLGMLINARRARSFENDHPISWAKASENLVRFQKETTKPKKENVRAYTKYFLAFAKMVEAAEKESARSEVRESSGEVSVKPERVISALISPSNEAEETIKTLIDSGLPLGIEIAFRGGQRAETLRLIRLAADYKKAKNSPAIIQAGTVLNFEDAQAAIEAGASTIITPGLTLSKQDIKNIRHYSGVRVVMGVGAPDEAPSAFDRGVDEVKVFPFDQTDVVKALSGPLPRSLYESLPTQSAEEALENLRRRIQIQSVEENRSLTDLTFTKARDFLGGHTDDSVGYFKRGLDKEALVAAIRAALPENFPVTITGGVSAESIKSGLLNRLNVSAALSVKDVASADALISALRQDALFLRQIAEPDYMSLDYDFRWAVGNPVRVPLLSSWLGPKSPRAISTFLIEKLAVPEVAGKINPPVLDALLQAAKSNPDIAAKAAAVREMVDQVAANTFVPFKFPGNLIKAEEISTKIPGVKVISKSDPQGSIVVMGKNPRRTSLFEKHPNTTQILSVIKGEVFYALAVAGSREIVWVKLSAGQAIVIPANIYHLGIPASQDAEIKVFNGTVGDPTAAVSERNHTAIFTAIGGYVTAPAQTQRSELRKIPQTQEELAQMLKHSNGVAVIPVAAAGGKNGAIAVAEKALQKDGIVEFTFRGTHEEVVATVREFRQKHPDVLIEIGTVHTAKQVRDAVEAGANVVVSPGTFPEVLDAVRNLQAEGEKVWAVPAVETVDEARLALETYSDVVAAIKVFPPVLMGNTPSEKVATFIAEKKGPLPKFELGLSASIDYKEIFEELLKRGVIKFVPSNEAKTGTPVATYTTIYNYLHNSEEPKQITFAVPEKWGFEEGGNFAAIVKEFPTAKIIVTAGEFSPESIAPTLAHPNVITLGEVVANVEKAENFLSAVFEERVILEVKKLSSYNEYALKNFDSSDTLATWGIQDLDSFKEAIQTEFSLSEIGNSWNLDTAIVETVIANILDALSAQKQAVARSKERIERLVNFIRAKNFDQAGQVADEMFRDANTQPVLALLQAESDKLVSNFLIERLALPDVARTVESANLETFLQVAESNRALAAKAQAVRRMMKPDFVPFQLPGKLIEASELAEKIPGVQVIDSKVTQGAVIKMGENLPRASLFEQHPATTQTLSVTQGSVYYAFAKEPGGEIFIIKVAAGHAVIIPANVYHLGIPATPDAEIKVFNGTVGDPTVAVSERNHTAIFTAIGGYVTAPAVSRSEVRKQTPISRQILAENFPDVEAVREAVVAPATLTAVASRTFEPETALAEIQAAVSEVLLAMKSGDSIFDAARNLERAVASNPGNPILATMFKLSDAKAGVVFSLNTSPTEAEIQQILFFLTIHTGMRTSVLVQGGSKKALQQLAENFQGLKDINGNPISERLTLSAVKGDLTGAANQHVSAMSRFGIQADKVVILREGSFVSDSPLGTLIQSKLGKEVRLASARNFVALWTALAGVSLDNGAWQTLNRQIADVLQARLGYFEMNTGGLRSVAVFLAQIFVQEKSAKISA